LIESELNVKSLRVLTDAGEVVQYKLNPLPAALGKKFGKDFPRVQKTLREGAEADVRAWAEALGRGENVTVTIDGQTFEVTPDEVQVLRNAAEGYSVAEDNGYLVALDATLTEDLIMEGLAREVVRRVQTLRRDADFNISDTIITRYIASERLASAIARFEGYIKSETLSAVLEDGEPGDGFQRDSFSFEDETLVIGVKRT
jgi:isoleucyl-tRNA synthetase